MRLVHRYGPLEDRKADTLASDVETADTTLRRARGLMFRRSVPDDYALVFRFDEPRPRTLHMLFVPVAIDALWIRGPEVVHKKRLTPFVGVGRASADLVVELPAGAAENVEPGDIVELVE